ncbi:MAG TPA: transaldolase family protein [Gemmatimonadaceae bacterium]|nr:transaldolase family protein [Gemmatimonadaceae bacterium]
MKLLLESANIDEVRRAAALGTVDGVITDPSLLAAAVSPEDHHERLAEICGAISGPVIAPVVAVDADAIHREGRALAKLADSIVVSVPMIEEALVGMRRLAADGIPVHVALIFNAAQALVAARAGATYVSAGVSRLEDAGQDGMTVVHDIRALFDRSGFECELIAGSLRSPLHVEQAAAAGAHAGAAPAEVHRLLLLHPLTDRGVDQYLNDWSRHLARSRAGG